MGKYNFNTSSEMERRGIFINLALVSQAMHDMWVDYQINLKPENCSPVMSRSVTDFISSPSRRKHVGDCRLEIVLNDVKDSIIVGIKLTGDSIRTVETHTSIYPSTSSGKARYYMANLTALFCTTGLTFREDEVEEETWVLYEDNEEICGRLYPSNDPEPHWEFQLCDADGEAGEVIAMSCETEGAATRAAIAYFNGWDNFLIARPAPRGRK